MEFKFLTAMLLNILSKVLKSTLICMINVQMSNLQLRVAFGQ